MHVNEQKPHNDVLGQKKIPSPPPPPPQEKDIKKTKNNKNHTKKKKKKAKQNKNQTQTSKKISMATAFRITNSGKDCCATILQSQYKINKPVRKKFEGYVLHSRR